MSNPPPSDAATSQTPGPPHGDTDPWNLQGALTGLPPPLQQLLNDIMRNCHAACCDGTETANGVTRELHRLLQQLVAAIDGELQSNPCSCLRTCRVCWHLLGRLAEGINRHFQFRPRIMFTGQDADLQSAAAAARGIKDCFTRSIELLSTDDDSAGNVASFAIFLMDSDGDAEASMRFAFLDLITRRIAAVKRPGRGWDAMVDGETVHLDEGCSASGCNAVIAPVLQFASAAVAAAACGDLEDFDDAKCSICLCASFDSSSDGSVSINVREMQCPGRHTFHSQCARRWFVDEKHSSCPYCRHDFSGLLCDRIAATLEHQVEASGTGFTVHWNKSPNQRLAALNVLLLLPRETPLGKTTASALLWSCFDAAAGVADVALRCGRLSHAIKGMLQGQIGMWCSRLVEAFAVAEKGAVQRRLGVAIAICNLAEEEQSRACLAAAGACGALVEALKVAEEDITKRIIAHAMEHLSTNEDGRTGLAVAGACGVLVEALKVAEEDDTRDSVARAMANIALSEEGRIGLAAAGACGALVEALKVAEEDDTRRIIAHAMENLSTSEDCRTGLAAAGACGALVEALKVAEKDITRRIIAYAMKNLSTNEDCRTGLAAAGACGALVEALKVAEEDDTRRLIARAMANLALSEEGRTGLAAAGACGVLVEALKVAEKDITRRIISYAMENLSKSEEGRAGLAAAGACGALVEALKVAAEDDTRRIIAYAMKNLSKSEEGRAGLTAAGACAALEAVQCTSVCCNSSIFDALESLQPHLHSNKRIKLSHGAP